MNWTMYISGLGQVTSDQRLREIYAPYGTVESAHMLTNRVTHQPTGLGIVRIEYPKAVDNIAAALREVRLAGYPIEAYCTRRHNRRMSVRPTA